VGKRKQNEIVIPSSIYGLVGKCIAGCSYDKLGNYFLIR